MAIDKALLDQLLAGREPQDLFAKGGLIDDLKKALSAQMLTAYQKGNPTLPVVTVQFSDPVPPGAPLLLAPLFPDAFGYRLDSFEVEHAELVNQLRTTNSAQEAYLIRPTAAPMRPILHYRLEAFDGDPPEWVWTPPATRYVIPSAELQGFITTLVKGASNEAEAL
jgi:hypothetical protein